MRSSNLPKVTGLVKRQEMGFEHLRLCGSVLPYTPCAIHRAAFAPLLFSINPLMDSFFPCNLTEMS